MTEGVLDLEAYSLVKHAKFDYASVTQMSSVQRNTFLKIYRMEIKARKKAMEDMKDKRHGGR